MKDETLEQLEQTLYRIQENTTTHKKLLDQANRTNEIYEALLVEMKSQTKLLEELKKSGKLVVVENAI